MDASAGSLYITLSVFRKPSQIRLIESLTYQNKNANRNKSPRKLLKL